MSSPIIGRQITLEILRGLLSELPPDLAWGEFFFAEDTFQLFVGTPGFGLGYIQIGDTTNVNETLLQILAELKAMRLALVALATESGRNKDSDFDPVFDETNAQRGEA
jgi:hypothetical protein